MAKGFRSRGGRVVGRLERDEVALLRDLLADVQALVLADGDDPMSRRLFPDASPDPVTAAELRDLLHDDLREAKLANLRAMAETLPDDGRVDLDAETADRWVAAINDVRLVYGTALGVTEDMDGSAYEDDPAMHLYGWLTFLQDVLIEALSAGGVER